MVMVYLLWKGNWACGIVCNCNHSHCLFVHHRSTVSVGFQQYVKHLRFW